MFKLIRVIRSKTGELHFCRWSIIETPWFNIYLHLLAKSDEDKHQHNHPWWFISVILLGGYLQESTKLIKDAKYRLYTEKKKWWPFFVGRDTFHKIELIEPTLTLVITGPRQKEDWGWGYLVGNEIIDPLTYRSMKNEGNLPI